MRALGAAALDVLLEIMADDSVSLQARDAIARHVLPLGAEGQDKRGLEYRRTAIERRQFTEHAGRITDAIIAYHRDNPSAQRLSGFVEIVPLDRLPNILMLCEDRREYLEIFSKLTHTDFHERHPASADNPTPEERAEHHRQTSPRLPPEMPRTLGGSSARMASAVSANPGPGYASVEQSGSSGGQGRSPGSPGRWKAPPPQTRKSFVAPSRKLAPKFEKGNGGRSRKL